MTQAISLDIETLSTHKNAVVASIGAVTVSSAGVGLQGKFHMRLAMQQQIDMGRHVSADTLKWWMQQDSSANFSAFIHGEEVAPLVALCALEAWMADLGSPPVWTNGPAFDGAILDSLAEDLGVPSPIKYRNHRDLRTIHDAVEKVKDAAFYVRYSEVQDRARRGRTAHNALDDAIVQGELVAWWFSELEKV